MVDDRLRANLDPDQGSEGYAQGMNCGFNGATSGGLCLSSPYAAHVGTYLSPLAVHDLYLKVYQIINVYNLYIKRYTLSVRPLFLIFIYKKHRSSYSIERRRHLFNCLLRKTGLPSLLLSILYVMYIHVLFNSTSMVCTDETKYIKHMEHSNKISSIV